MNHGLPVLGLYHIAYTANVNVVREYELPEAWSNSSIGFCANTSPRADIAASSDALFYPDPAARILLLTVKPPHHTAGPSRCPRNWLFINESFFGPPARRDRVKVPWNHWSQYCLVRAVAPTANLIRGPYITGARVLFLDWEPTHHSSRGPASGRSDSTARLNIIDFSPFPDVSIRPSQTWTWIGQQTTLVPNEAARHLPLETTDYMNVEGVRVTEDNIVLFLVRKDK
jgi:hypothetical protein